MKNFGLLIVYIFVISGFVFAQKYVVDTAIGDVFVKTKGKTKGVEVGYVLKGGDVLYTGKDSECYVLVNNKGYIKLEENSSITFEQIELVVKGKSVDSLKVLGSVIFSVKGIFVSGNSLNIKTDNAFATVRGTEFVVENPKKATTIYVLEGRVAVAPLFSDVEDELVSKSILVEEGEKIEISEIDVINSTSFLQKGDEEGYGIFLKGKKKPLIASEKERFSQRMKMLRELQKKRLKELEEKKKKYLKDPSELFKE
ncbi:MAG: FecR domain-containing protein [Brevinematia bacterium]